MARKTKKVADDAARPVSAAAEEKCLACGTTRREGEATCHDCGYCYDGPAPIVWEGRADPNTIREGENSRVVAAANYLDTVVRMATDIFINGQIAPVEVRKVGEDQYETISGNTRRDAVKLIREGFKAKHPHTGDEQLFHDADRLLWVKAVNVSAEAAFLRGIAENLERTDTTDLQEALAQDHLRVSYGWSDTRIAALYRYTNQNRVMHLKKLIALDKKTQTLVHEGKLALSVALMTEGVTDEERETIIEAAKDGDKVRGSVVASLIRDHFADKAVIKAAGLGTTEIPDGTPAVERAKREEAAEGKRVAPKRNRAELQSFLSDEDAREDLKDAVRNFLGVLFKFMDGTRNANTLRNALNDLNDKTKG